MSKPFHLLKSAAVLKKAEIKILRVFQMTYATTVTQFQCTNDFDVNEIKGTHGVKWLAYHCK